MEQNCDAVPPYPESIIPSYSFKDVIEEKDLTAIEHRLVIQRRASASDLDIVTPESFGTNLAEMSVNLMGGSFQPGFIFLIPDPIPEVSKEWYVKKTENENQAC